MGEAFSLCQWVDSMHYYYRFAIPLFSTQPKVAAMDVKWLYHLGQPASQTILSLHRSYLGCSFVLNQKTDPPSPDKCAATVGRLSCSMIGLLNFLLFLLSYLDIAKLRRPKSNLAI